MPGIAGVQASVANFMSEVGWLNQQQLRAIGDSAIRSLIPTLSRPVSRTTADQICSLPIQISSFNTASVPGERYTEDTFIDILKCLGVTEPAVVNRIIQQTRDINSPNPVRLAGLSYLMIDSLIRTPEVRSLVMDSLSNPRESEEVQRRLIVWYLNRLMPFSQSELVQIRQLALDTNRDISDRGDLYAILRCSGLLTAQMELEVIEELLKKEDRNFSDRIHSEVLGREIRPSSDAALNKLIDIVLEDYSRRGKQEFATFALEVMDYKNESIAKRLVGIVVSDNVDSNQKNTAARALRGFKTRNSTMLIPLLRYLTTLDESYLLSQLGQTLRQIAYKVHIPDLLARAKVM